MSGDQRKSLDSHLPTDHLGHPRPRRTSPEQSVTLQHHRQARDAARRDPMGRTGAPSTARPKRNSTDGGSHGSTKSNPKLWFDQSNRNDKMTFDANSMDVDPPFFQKETDSSNEEQGAGSGASLQDPPYPFDAGTRPTAFLRAGVTQSSSADDYRSVIDDLTIENKRLKEELKRYKQFGPDMMRREKLFEIKVHGLPKRKKRELEATLRDFAASLEGSSESPPQRKKQDRRGQLYSEQSMSKHASSSSSRSRPVDSAYHSISTGPRSNVPNFSHVSGRPSAGVHTRTSAEEKVEDYLRDTPGGLFPRHVVMTDKDKKKMVVRRLEQLFTGKIGWKKQPTTQTVLSGEQKSASDPTLPMAPPPNTEAAREARIQPTDPSGRKPRSRDNVSMSNSNGDHTDSGGHAGEGADGSTVAVRMGNITSPSAVQPPEQRPTRPKDLDPDRAQVPSENLEYIRHLGLVHPAFNAHATLIQDNVSPDADGWVYLNLLCNLAQLHIYNVTPNFIRAAVTEKSAKFQLSADGRKIRWRGGTDGTRFSSDSSGDNSQRSLSDDSEGSEGNCRRKRVKTQRDCATWGSPNNAGPQASGSPDSFHYKPMFIRHSSSMETSLEGTGSQASDPLMDSSNMGNTGNSKWNYSGSGSSQRRKRRVDGAIVYYSGAPFCIDLSGDPGDVSPGGLRKRKDNGDEKEKEADEDAASQARPATQRTLSGSSLPIRPSSEAKAVASQMSDSESDDPQDLLDDDETASSLEEVEAEFPWCDNPMKFHLRPSDSTLEACGVGGVLPEDHFVVVVATSRPIYQTGAPTLAPRCGPMDSVEAILDRLRLARTSSPDRLPAVVDAGEAIEIDEIKTAMWRLKPMPLPPAASYFPPFSSDTGSDESDDETDSYEEMLAQQRYIPTTSISQVANPHLSASSEDDELLSDEDKDDGVDHAGGENPSDVVRLRPPTIASAGTGKRPELLHTGSSVATAGGAESGYSSSMEDEAS